MTDYTDPTTEIRAGYAINCYDVQGALEEFDQWLVEEIRKAKEEAWEEGWDKGFDVAAEAYQYGRMDASGVNPYRKEQND